MAKKILAIDIGYGDIKVTFGDDTGNITKKFKYTSLIGVANQNEFVKDSRIMEFNGMSYYVGEHALHLPTDALIDITEYKNLEYFAPLFLQYTVQEIGETPDIIVTGLSKSQLSNSAYFKERLMDYTIDNIQHLYKEVYVLPQGAGSKLTIDKYGINFPHPQTEYTGTNTYIGVDIGFSTNDFFLVNNGTTSPGLFDGYEKEGIMKIAFNVHEKVKELYGRSITLKEAKEIINNGYYKLRGQQYDFSEYIEELKKQYLQDIMTTIEQRHGDKLDKCDFIFLSGGGSTLFIGTQDPFFRIPKTDHEFYNSIGFYLFGVQKALSTDKTVKELTKKLS